MALSVVASVALAITFTATEEIKINGANDVAILLQSNSGLP